MKKFIFLLIIITLMSAGCVTNNYNEEDYNNNKKPLGPWTSALIGIVPGVPQYFHGEYVEGAIYSASFVAYVVSLNLMTDPETGEVLSGNEIPMNIAMSVGVSSILTSMIDGYITGKKRVEQYQPYKVRMQEQRYENLKRRYGEKDAKVIMEGGIYIGMSRSALIQSWGPPDDINTTVGDFGTYEQLVYRNPQNEFDATYVYIENGEVKSWQN